MRKIICIYIKKYAEDCNDLHWSSTESYMVRNPTSFSVLHGGQLLSQRILGFKVRAGCSPGLTENQIMDV